jgi:tellurite resistance protein TerC
MLFRTIDQVRRFFKILGGFTLLLIGGIMLVTPGPGWLVIFLGLTVLAAEFVWARRLMDRMKHQGNRLKDSVLKFGKTDSA